MSGGAFQADALTIINSEKIKGLGVSAGGPYSTFWKIFLDNKYQITNQSLADDAINLIK